VKRSGNPQPLSLIETVIVVASQIALVGKSNFLFGDSGASTPNRVVRA